MLSKLFKSIIKPIREIKTPIEERLFNMYIKDKTSFRMKSENVNVKIFNTGFVKNERRCLFNANSEPEFVNKTDADYTRSKHNELVFEPQTDSYVLNIDIKLDDKNSLTIQIERIVYARLIQKNSSAKKLNIKFTRKIFLNNEFITFEEFSNNFSDFLKIYNQSIKEIIQSNKNDIEIARMETIEKENEKQLKLSSEKQLRTDEILALRK